MAKRTKAKTPEVPETEVEEIAAVTTPTEEEVDVTGTPVEEEASPKTTSPKPRQRTETPEEIAAKEAEKAAAEEAAAEEAIAAERVERLESFKLDDLYRAGKTDEEKLEWVLSEYAPKEVVYVATRFQAFRETMMQTTDVNMTSRANMVYDVSNTIQYILKKEYAEFRPLFATVNLFFRLYKADAFNDMNLMSYAQKWNKKPQEVRTFNKLVVMLADYCEPANRKNALKTTAINNVFDKATTRLTEDGRINVTKYYGA